MAEAPAHSTVDRDRLTRLLEVERARFRDDHPRSLALLRARRSLPPRRRPDELDGQVGVAVPAVRRGGVGRALPLRRRPRVHRLLPRRHRRDGRPRPVRRRSPPSSARCAAGITHMLPTEDAIWAGEELGRRFGLPLWQFTITATDANRFSIRLARQAPAGRRSSSTTTATTARSTRRSRRSTPTGASSRRGATSARRCRRPRRRGSCRSTTSTRSSARSPTATSRRAHRAGADERRDRAARARLPRGAPRDHAADRHDPDHRRDPHDLRRARRRARARRPRARHARDRQDDRRRDPGRGVRDDRRRSPIAFAATMPARTPTSAGSAGRWPATRCRWRPSGRRSARCSRRRRSSG